MTNPVETLSIAERTLSVLAAVAEVDEVWNDPDLALFDTRVLDSMKTVELILELSKEFSIEISPAEVEREEWATPRRILEYVERRLSA